MRPRRAATALLAVTAGLAASAAVRLVSRAAARRTARPAAPVVPAPARTVPGRTAPAVAAPQRDAVVLPFARPVAVVPVPPAPAARARCGDNGGRTKAGAPCGARATSGGRCHHHRAAA